MLNIKLLKLGPDQAVIVPDNRAWKILSQGVITICPGSSDLSECDIDNEYNIYPSGTKIAGVDGSSVNVYYQELYSEVNYADVITTSNYHLPGDATLSFSGVNTTTSSSYEYYSTVRVDIEIPGVLKSLSFSGSPTKFPCCGGGCGSHASPGGISSQDIEVGDTSGSVLLYTGGSQYSCYSIYGLTVTDNFGRIYNTGTIDPYQLYLDDNS